MSTAQTQSAPPVVRAATVERSADAAFTIFTDQIGAWWPLPTHGIFGDSSGGVHFADGHLAVTEPEEQLDALTRRTQANPVDGARDRIVGDHIEQRCFGFARRDVPRIAGGIGDRAGRLCGRLGARASGAGEAGHRNYGTRSKLSPLTPHQRISFAVA